MEILVLSQVFPLPDIFLYSKEILFILMRHYQKSIPKPQLHLEQLLQPCLFWEC